MPDFEVDISDLDAAGGGANDAMKSQIDFSQVANDGERRPFRGKINGPPSRQAPATTEGIASPTRNATIESPRAWADQRLRESGMFMEGGNEARPMTWVNSDVAARERLASPYCNTHDKSLPNARRTQRGTGTCLPAPPVADTAHVPGNGAPPAFLTDFGFASAAMHRRARGTADPPRVQPTSNPNEAGAPPPVPMHAHGMASGSSHIDGLLGGRRARGQCSPRVERASHNLLAWDT